MTTTLSNHAYVPPSELTVDPGLHLHTATDEVDPITYEVLRHNLWASRTARSSSPGRSSSSCRGRPT
jgi:hypothetical protein